uniref:DNA polymerase alpha subunit B n=2 Tax=Dendroctonus ponderosae TaxID=77166 RepID=A0AAR5QK73_DENPD
MASVDDITGQFELFNIKPTNEVVSKCLDLCLKYNISGEDMVDQWFAYTTSVLNGAAPSLEYLEKLERKELMKKKDHTDQHTSPVVVSEELLDKPDNLLRTPKGNHGGPKRIQTPAAHGRKLLDENMDISITSSPSGSCIVYAQRPDSRSVRCSYGLAKAKFHRSGDLDLQVKPLYEDGLQPNQKWMHEVLGRRSKCIDMMIEDFFSAIMHKHQLKLPDVQDTIGDGILLYGRIISDAGGKLNNQSVLLEQTQAHRGNTVTLNLSKLKKYSLFSGQVVAVKGTYLKSGNQKDKFVVDAIYSDASFHFLPDPPLIKDTLQVVVACGPFTVRDNLCFEPLSDLLQYVKEYKPHVLILTGPFYDENHQGVHNGELRQSTDSFFRDLIHSTMHEVPETHVIVVSSRKEPHHFPVYPTPPYEVGQDYANLTLMPDPCMVNINGLVVGTTTADILFDIGSFECSVDQSNRGPPDRIGRLASYLLTQQSFYPLDPAGKDVYIDLTLMERNGVMEVKPHILILPSNLRFFVKEINGCLVVNPERLSKGSGGGSFARIEISPGSTQSICGRTACEVLKI